MSTPLECWIKYYKNIIYSRAWANTTEPEETRFAREAIAVIEKLKEEMEFAMKYYESCGDEAEPETQLFQSFKKALAIDMEKL